MKIKKILSIIIPLVLVVVLAISGFIVFKKIDAYKSEVEYRDGVIAALNGKIDTIGALTTCYELNYDVKSGTVVEEADLSQVEMPEKSAVGYVQNINDVLGKRYVTNIGAGTVLHDSLVYENDLTGDLRYLDVVFDEIPIGLEPGDYVDVRISFGIGQDFLAMSRKEVIQINSKVVKLVVNEKDVHTYESMNADKGEYASVRIYGTQYIQAGTQKEITNYYPIRMDALTQVVQDPNITGSIEQYSYASRELLESQLVSKVDMAKPEEERDYRTQLAIVIDEAKQQINQQFEQGELSYKNGGVLVDEYGNPLNADGSSSSDDAIVHSAGGALLDPGY